MHKLLLFIFYFSGYCTITNAQQTFHKSYSGGFSNHPYRVINGEPGTKILAGYVYDSGGPGHVYLIKTDDFGNVLWDRIFDPSTNVCTGIIRTPDSCFAVVGFCTDTFSFSIRDVLLMKIKTQGNVLWQASYSALY